MGEREKEKERQERGGREREYIYIILTIKKNEILPFVTTWLMLESIRLGKIGKDKFHRISLICGNSKIRRAKERKQERGKPRNRLLTIENKLRVTIGDVGGEMG